MNLLLVGAASLPIGYMAFGFIALVVPPKCAAPAPASCCRQTCVCFKGLWGPEKRAARSQADEKTLLSLLQTLPVKGQVLIIMGRRHVSVAEILAGARQGGGLRRCTGRAGRGRQHRKSQQVAGDAQVWCAHWPSRLLRARAIQYTSVLGPTASDWLEMHQFGAPSGLLSCNTRVYEEHMPPRRSLG